MVCFIGVFSIYFADIKRYCTELAKGWLFDSERQNLSVCEKLIMFGAKYCSEKYNY